MPKRTRKKIPPSPPVPADETVPLSYLARTLHEEGSKELPSVVQICAQLAAKEDDPIRSFCCSLMLTAHASATGQAYPPPKPQRRPWPETSFELVGVVLAPGTRGRGESVTDLRGCSL